MLGAEDAGFRAAGEIGKAITKEYADAQMQAKAAKQLLESASNDAERQLARQMLDKANTTMAAHQGQYDLWKEGGTGKTLLHAVTGALVAATGGGNVLQGALGAGAAELGRPLTADESRWVQQLASAGIGLAVGGGAGAATALAGEQYNRQLHPSEIKKIEENAAGFAAQEFGCAGACTIEQVELAKQRLMVQAIRQVDERWNEVLGYGGLRAQDGPAQAFLNGIGSTHGQYTDFAADGDQYRDGSLFADRLRGTQALSQFYGAVLATAKNEGEKRSLLQALNRTDASWRKDYVSGVMSADAWTLFTLFTGDAGFAAELSRKLLAGDDQGAAQDLLNAVLLSRLGAAGGQVIAKFKGPAAVAANRAMEEAANEAARKAQGVYGVDGKPLMDFSRLTNPQKMLVGELLGEQKVLALVPDGKFIGRSQGVGETGIDNILQVNRPDVDFVIVEYKFGTSKLGNTVDGKQMSNSWLSGKKTGEDRILKSVEDAVLAKGIRSSLDAGRVERWVVHADPSGGVSVGLLEKNGTFVPNPAGVSNLLGDRP